MENKNNKDNEQNKLEDLYNKIYRFAVIGVSSSGKTCILARMASGADKAYPSSLVPPTTSSNPDSTSGSSPDGYKKILEAKNELEAYRIPDATGRDVSGRLHVSFDIDDKQRGEFRIWTEDYAGELINPDELSDEQSQAWRLKQNLSQYDGIVFVLETLKDGDDYAKAENDTSKICSFFSAIKDCMTEERWNQMPFAVIFSKWDRYVNSIDWDKPAEEDRRLNEYLHLPKNEAYANFVKRIRIITGMQNAPESEMTNLLKKPFALSSDNTKNFPVSALGKVTVVDGQIKPSSSKAFNLVAPFVWMANRLDEIKYAQLQKAGKSCWSWLCIDHNKKVIKDANTALRRVPKNTSNGRGIRGIRQSAFAKIFFNLALYFLIILGIAFGTLFNVDQSQLTHLKELLKAPTTTESQVTNEENKILDYAKSLERQYFNFLRPAKFVIDDVNSTMKEFDDNLWKQIEDAKTLQEKYPFASHYLKVRPNGQHKDDALNILGTYVNDVIDKETNPENQIKLCDEFLNNFPEGALSEKVKKIRQDAVNKVGWLNAKDAYERLYTGNDYISLANTLKELIPIHGLSEDRCAPLVRVFPENFKKVFERAINGKPTQTIVEDKFTNAEQQVNNLIGVVDDAKLKDVLQNYKKDLIAQKDSYVEKLDQELYNDAQKNPSEENLKKYIEVMEKHPTIAKMLVPVKKRLDWNDILKTPRNYTLSFVLECGDDVRERAVSYNIWVDKEDTPAYPCDDLRLNKNLVKDLCKITVEDKKLKTDSVWVKATFIGNGNTWLGKDYVFATGQDRLSLFSVYENGFGEIDIPDPKGWQKSAKLRIKIDDAPQAPKLPEYPKSK